MGADDPLRHPASPHPSERTRGLRPNRAHRAMGGIEPGLYVIEDVLLPTDTGRHPQPPTEERPTLEARSRGRAYPGTVHDVRAPSVRLARRTTGVAVTTPFRAPLPLD